MNSQGFVDALQITQQLQFQFVLAEIDLATTFIDIAMNTRMDSRLRRNSKLAHQARDTAVRFFERCIWTSPMKNTVNDRLHKLWPKLQELDRRS